jgi:hypothetical protein
MFDPAKPQIIKVGNDPCYEHLLRCTNCNHHLKAEIEKGIRVTDPKVFEQPCPRCGCQTLRDQ